MPKKPLPGLVRDGVGLGGAAVAAYGFWLAWHPLGFIVGGVALVAFAYLADQGTGN